MEERLVVDLISYFDVTSLSSIYGINTKMPSLGYILNTKTLIAENNMIAKPECPYDRLSIPR